LDNLDLSVKEGEIFGYLGPNGAGKTTTIRMMLDIIRPTSGRINILGMDAQKDAVELHHQIGFMPGELNLWKNEKAIDIVKYFGRVRGKLDMAYATQLAERLQFDMSKKVRDYSTGNKRKLGLVLALMNRPKLLILDEPTSGLDPLMQQTFNHLMREVRDEGRTVFLSSHVLSEVQAICDRVGILRGGILRAVENVENLTHANFRWVTVNYRGELPDLTGIAGVSEVTKLNGDAVKLRLTGDVDPLLRTLVKGEYISNFKTQEPTLEEIFLAFYDEGEVVS
jgi:ABC-2 type transport system ATP-binding protein